MKTVLYLFILLLLIPAPVCRASSGSTLHVGAYTYKPLLFKGENGHFSGVYPDIIEVIARREGLTIEYVEGSWTDCLDRLESGTIDLLPAIAYSTARAERFRFNQETVLTNWGRLYTRPGMHIESFIDLDGKKIAVYQKGIFSESLMRLARQIGLNCTFVPAPDYETIFQMIETDQVDAGVANNLFGRANAPNYRVKRSNVIFMPTELRFAAPRQASSELLEQIDNHLAQLKADKDSVYYQSIGRWAIDRWAVEKRHKRLSRWILIALTGALGLAAVFFLASMWLRHQVRQKAIALIQSDQRLGLEIEAKELTGKALREKDRMLSTLMGNLPGMAYRCQADDKRTIDFVSQGCTALLEYSTNDFGPAHIEFLNRLVHPDDLAVMTAGIAEATAQNDPYRLVYRMRTGSGVYKWVCDHGVGVIGTDQKVAAFEGFITDITQQQETELALRRENERLQGTLDDRFRLGQMIGKSDAIRRIYGLIVKAGASRDPVMITGESGTGKELAARAIHDLSCRAEKPFVPVNCGAITQSLLESEFFGHVKGAFTGADAPKAGLLDAAAGGTLFLDEVGDIDTAMQVKLLRAIDGGGYTPVGATQIKHADVRIIAATNKDLVQLMEKGRLREDFYYRLNVLPIHLPPLRRRKEDIPLLVDHFLEKYDDDDTHLPPFTGNIMEAFCAYHWPGNVRELQNAVHRYVVFGTLTFAGKKMATTTAIANSDPVNQSGMMATTDLRTATARFEKQYIQHLLETHQWHRGKVAQILGINRKTLFTKIKNHRIKGPRD